MNTRVDLSVNITSGNDAFQEGRAPAEVARILRALAEAIERGAEGYTTLHDINGNRIGRAMLEIWGDDD